MKRAARRRLALLIAVLALIGAVLWFGRRDYLRDPQTLTPLDTDAVTRIELTIADGAPQVFEKHGEHWWRSAPGKTRADDARLTRLAELGSAPVARWAARGAFDRARIGLQPPSATLVLNDTRLQFGGLSALDNLRYVQVGERIALVPQQYSPQIVLAMDQRAGE